MFCYFVPAHFLSGQGRVERKMADSSIQIAVQEPEEREGVKVENENEPVKGCLDNQEDVSVEQPKNEIVEKAHENDETGEKTTADEVKEAGAENDQSAPKPTLAEKEEVTAESPGEDEKPHKDKNVAAKGHRTPPMERAEKKKEDISDAQRKAKIEEIRKRKITEYKKKEDEKRKAVLERKKKLEEAERLKHEALLKKISASMVPTKRPASAPARRAVSFSSLAHLKKTHAVAQEIDIGEGKPTKAKEAEDKSVKTAENGSDRRRTLPPRPVSAMERKLPNSISSDKGKPANKDVSEKGGSEKSGTRPKSSFGTRAEPKIRQSISNLPYRPSSAASHRPTPTAEDGKPKAAASKSRPSMPPLPGKPLVPPNKDRDVKKAKSLSSPPQQKVQDKTKGPLQPGRKVPDSAEKTTPKTAAAKESTAKPRPDQNKPPRPSTGKAKESARPTSAAKREKVPPKASSPAAKTDAAKKAVVMDEAEAKRIMAEKRRQVKEEQERKKLEEENRLEEERIRKEEEQKRRAEELLKEQERQKAHLEELRKEAEERERKEKEEKLRKEMEEKEKLEAEKRQRQEDIDRRAQEEVEKRAKEREHKRQQEEAERLERKKRVQEILGTRLRGSPVADRPSSPIPFAATSPDEVGVEQSPPAIDSASSARDRVQKLLEKSNKKSDDSPNSSENGEAPTLVKPQLSPGKSSAESYNEDLSQRANDKPVDISKMNGQSHGNTLESSLTEADKQTMEDEKRRSIEAADVVIDNGTADSEQIAKEENQNIDVKSEEKVLWGEAEKAMGVKNKDDLSNSFEKQTTTKIEQTQSSQEGALWRLVEGQLEFEECF